MAKTTHNRTGWLRPRELGDLLGIDRRNIHNAINTGELKAMRLSPAGAKIIHHRVRIEDGIAWARARGWREPTAAELTAADALFRQSIDRAWLPPADAPEVEAAAAAIRARRAAAAPDLAGDPEARTRALGEHAPAGADS
jgi:hypothetical protein